MTLLSHLKRSPDIQAVTQNRLNSRNIKIIINYRRERGEIIFSYFLIPKRTHDILQDEKQLRKLSCCESKTRV
jgi:hypothetical protein